MFPSSSQNCRLSAKQNFSEAAISVARLYKDVMRIEEETTRSILARIRHFVTIAAGPENARSLNDRVISVSTLFKFLDAQHQEQKNPSSFIPSSSSSSSSSTTIVGTSSAQRQCDEIFCTTTPNNNIHINNTDNDNVSRHVLSASSSTKLPATEFSKCITTQNGESKNDDDDDDQLLQTSIDFNNNHNSLTTHKNGANYNHNNNINNQSSNNNNNNNNCQNRQIITLEQKQKLRVAVIRGKSMRSLLQNKRQTCDIENDTIVLTERELLQELCNGMDGGVEEPPDVEEGRQGKNNNINNNNNNLVDATSVMLMNNLSISPPRSLQYPQSCYNNNNNQNSRMNSIRLGKLHRIEPE